MMTLFQVEILPPPGGEGEDAEPVHAEVMRAGPAIRMPYEGDRFTVRDDWGRTHAGVIQSVEDMGVTNGADLLGEDRAREEKATTLRIVRLTIAPRAA